MEIISEILANPVYAMLLKILVIILVLVMPSATVLTLMERKWSSFIQDRVGPNRANIGKFRGRGVLHLAADGIKSILKEDFIPAGTNKFLFTIAPFFGFIGAAVTFSVIPLAGPLEGFTFQITDVNIGLLVVFAFTSLSVFGAVLAGWSTENKYALLGSIRASAQMISYEVFLGLSLLGIFMVYESLRISDIVAGQNMYWFNGWIPKWGIFTQPIAFFVFFTAAIAETKRAPFDAPEGESEIIAGYFLEYSGMRFAAFMLSEYIALVGVAALMVTLFFGSYHVPWLHDGNAAGFYFGSFDPILLSAPVVTLLQFIAFIVKMLFFCWLQLMIRWTLPKFRFDQTMTLGWKKLLPVSLFNVLATALVILFANNYHF